VKERTMVLGMSLGTFTALHVLLSLIGIGSGVVVVWGLISGKPLNGLTAIFLVTTVLTSVTGFLFPVDHILPSHKVGLLSLIILAVVIPARYVFKMAGAWRTVYVIGSAAALYLNVFVLVVQSFLKVPALKALAPTQQEPPFLIAQLVLLLIFVAVTILAVKKFHVLAVRAV
jgi:hypothetical protein